MTERKIQEAIHAALRVAAAPSSPRSALRERDVVAQYAFCRGQLRKWRRVGGPPFCKIGRMIVYRRESIEEYLRAHEIKK